MYYNLFECLPKKDSMDLVKRIGTYVSHKIVRKWSVLSSVEELNSLDRFELAKEWYLYETYHTAYKKPRWEYLISHFYNQKDDFFDEVARYIDDRIPRAYAKYSAEKIDNSRGPSTIKLEYNDDGSLVSGLIYHYPPNTQFASFFVEATEKQIKYLTDLSAMKNYMFYKEGISKGEASECINFFLNMDYEVEPACFNSYFRKGF